MTVRKRGAANTEQRKYIDDANQENTAPVYFQSLSLD